MTQLFEETSSFFRIYELVGTIVGLLAEQKETKTILSIGCVSRRHNEYIHSLKLWKCFFCRALNDRSNYLNSRVLRSIVEHAKELQFTSELCSNDRSKQLLAVRQLCSQIAQKDQLHSLFDVVIRLDILPNVVQLLDLLTENYRRKESQTELNDVITILTNVATGTAEHQQSVIDAGAVKHLLRLLTRCNSDPQGELTACCAWALSYIVEDKPQLCDELLEANVLKMIRGVLGLMPDFCKEYLLMLYRSLCQSSTPDKIDVLLSIVPSILTVLRKRWFVQGIVKEACTAFDQLLCINFKATYHVLQTTDNALHVFVALSTTNDLALKIVQTIIRKGSTMHIQEILSAGFLDQVKCVLKKDPSEYSVSLTAVLLTLSLILAEYAASVFEFIQDGKVLPLVLKHLTSTTSDEKVKIEAAWVFAMALNDDRSARTYSYLTTIGAIDALYKVLGELRRDVELIERLLHLLKNGLKFEHKQTLK